MPTTAQMLREHTPKLIEIIAELRSTDLDPGIPVGQAAPILADSITSPASVANVLEELAEEYPGTIAALQQLKGANGEILEYQFVRNHGPLQIPGDANLAESEAWLHPSSVSEVLYFYALIGRYFSGSGREAASKIYIPTDILPLIPEPEGDEDEQGLDIEPARPPATEQILDTADYLLSDLLSYLAVLFQNAWRLRDGVPRPEDTERLKERLLVMPDTDLLAVRLEFLCHLAAEMELVEDGRTEVGQAIRTLHGNNVHRFLMLDRAAQRRALWDTWFQSGTWSDLRHVPILDCRNLERWGAPAHAAGTRGNFGQALASLPLTQWFRLPDVVEAVHRFNPDFQRTTGDYDSWYVWHREKEAFVGGFDNWRLVEGELARFLLEGPLLWLDAVRQADNRGGPPILTLTREGAVWLGRDLELLPVSARPRVAVHPDFRVEVPVAMDLHARFRVERFANWVRTDQVYRYQINQRSLDRAFSAGLTATQIVEALRTMTNDLPETIANGIRRYEERKGR